ncbi:MAG: hypothetical protein CSA68_10245 [Rhodobacterales bacterium]|nr:MAG: hypothetical protein CSA68_10245 [Rhodobacterales bacterium]
MSNCHGIVVGMDGGGSGCRVAVARVENGAVGRVLGRGQGGPANPATDFQVALDNLRGAIHSAWAQAGLPEDDLPKVRAFAGLAGVRDEEMARRVAQALPFVNSQVVEDRLTSVTGALAGENGSVAPIGTGSFLARQTAQGVRYLGGWGLALGDDASGAWLGQQLLRQMVRCFDGIAPHCDLSQQALAEFNHDHARIFRFSSSAGPARFAKFAPMVVEAAKQGDPLGHELMTRGADYIVAGLAALGYETGERLCLSGGLGPHYADYLPAPYRDAMRPPKGNALDGALYLAARGAG